MSFEPKILGFLCNWCSYAGADLAGVSRIQYPTNMRVIRVMCSGRVDPKFIFHALELGIDGVFIMGCHPGDCHYLEGNYEAITKFEMTQHFLKFISFDERVRLDWVSASEGIRFGEVVTEFIKHIKELGPSPLSGENPDEDILDRLKAIKLAAGSKRMRALVGREKNLLESENVYGEQIIEERFNILMVKAVKDEFERHRVLIALEKDSNSVKDLAVDLDIDPSIVLEHIITLKTRGQVDFQEIKGNTPIFMRLWGI